MRISVILGSIGVLLAAIFYMRTPDTTTFYVLDPIRDKEKHFAAGTYPEYKPEAVNVPQLHGLPVKVLGWLTRIPLLGDVYVSHITRDNKYPQVRRFAAHVPNPRPMYYPYSVPPLEQLKVAEEVSAKENANFLSPEKLGGLKAGGVEGTEGQSVIISKYYNPYKAGKLTPSQVVERTLKAVEETHGAAGNRSLRAFVHMGAAEAKASAKLSDARWKEGKPLSLLDGVPIAVKVEFSVKGFPHTLGTAFLDDNIAKADGIPVRKLRAAGAIIIGVTNMQEIGLGVTGFNAHYGTARNPHNLRHHTGGSSSGTGSAVAAGLVPVGLGGDGGGSIRIPAAFCGLVGIKPTYGRVTLNGGGLAATVVHVGPLAGTVADAVIAYDILAKADPSQDHEQLLQPAPTYSGLYDTSDLKGVRIGVFKQWNADAHKEVQLGVQEALDDLVKRGAELVPITFPYLDIVLRSHTISILTEMAQAIEKFPSEHRHGFSWPILNTLVLPRQGLTPEDYIAAQVARQWFYDTYRGIFKKHKLTALVMPATGEVAPEIHQAGEESKTGYFNLQETVNIMKYATLGNLIGAPAIVVPRRRSAKNGGRMQPEVPLSVQLMGDHWDEASLWRLAAALHQPMTAADVFVQDSILKHK